MACAVCTFDPGYGNPVYEHHTYIATHIFVNESGRSDSLTVIKRQENAGIAGGCVCNMRFDLE